MPPPSDNAVGVNVNLAVDPSSVMTSHVRSANVANRLSPCCPDPKAAPCTVVTVMVASTVAVVFATFCAGII